MDWIVQNARNTDVERQHLNKILAEISASIVKIDREVRMIANRNVQDVVGDMLTGEQTGIQVWYDSTKGVINFRVPDFTIRLTGDVTGTGTVSALSDVNIVTTLDGDVGISDAPNTGAAFWRRAQAWEEVPVLIESLSTLPDNGLLVATDTGITSREIEGVAGNIEVADGDGVGGNPTIDLADLPDNGTGQLLAIDRDDKGRVEGTRLVTPDDIPNPLHTYMVDENGDYLVDENGDFIISDEFDLSDYALLTSVITNGDTTHSPSGDAVSDALATKQGISSNLSAIAALDGLLDPSDLFMFPGAAPSAVNFPVNTFPARASTGELEPKAISDVALDMLATAEIGTFTPTALGTTTAGTGTYTEQTGTYILLSNVLHFNISITWTAHTGTGNLRLGNLPFTSAAGLNYPAVVGLFANLTLPANAAVTADVVGGTNQSRILIYSTAGGSISAVGLTIDTAMSIQVSGTYFL